MMKQWIFTNEDGSIEQVYSDKKPHPKAHPLDRFGDFAVERHDGKGWVPRDLEARHAAIDAGHDADHGSWQRVIDYAVKEIEARVLLGTLAVDGRVAREADLRGMSVTDLAKEIVAKADAREVETKRVAAKVAAAK
jgi:hypothetical protein